MRFQVLMRMRGEMFMLREDDITILIGVIASFKVLRQCTQQDYRMNCVNCLQQ